MKILHITSTPVSYPGGMEKVIWEISKRLSKKGHEVSILQTDLYDKKTKHEKYTEKQGVKIITCKNNSFLFGYGYSSSFKKELKKIWRGFDLVHIHGCGRFTTDFSLKLLGGKIPIIFTAHGFFHSKKAKIFKFLDGILLKKNFKKIGFATALTKAEYSGYKKMGVGVDRVVEIPNGIDLKKFKSNQKEINNLQKKYEINKKLVLYVGRIHKSKGLEYLIRAVKDIDCQVLIVGRDSGYKKELEKIAKKLGIRDKIIFTGAVSEKELVNSYFASDVFVLASEHEGFGLVVIEAMACGLPVIVSDRGSLPYIVNNEKNGFVFGFGNIKELNNKIKKVFEEGKNSKKISLEAKKDSKKCDWDNIVKMYEKVYKKAVLS